MVFNLKNLETYYNTYFKNINKKEKSINKKEKHNKYLLGLVIYLIAFVCIIPLILYNLKYYDILEVYLPNVDLIANVVGWTGGPYGIWNSLYTGDETFMQFTSETIINYISLLGLTYIVSRETHKNNSIIKGWSFAFVMLLLTYLLPANIVKVFMDYVYKKLQTHNYPDVFSKFLGFFVGVFGTLLFLLIEKVILSQYRTQLTNIVKYFHKIII